VNGLCQQTVSHAADGKTVRHHWRSKTLWIRDWNIGTDNPVMKTKYTSFRRGEMFFIPDSATGKHTSLRTKNEAGAKSLLNARNEVQRQPVLNLHLARAYLTGSTPVRNRPQSDPRPHPRRSAFEDGMIDQVVVGNGNFSSLHALGDFYA